MKAGEGVGGWGENAPEVHQAPPAFELPAILQQALKCFQNKKVVESLGEDLLQDRVAQCFGEFLMASNLALSKA